jgi:hypothetical protein
MFISSHGVVRSRKAPAFEQWDGLQIASYGDDLITVVTDVNWGVSLSGETPLLVSLSD